MQSQGASQAHYPGLLWISESLRLACILGMLITEAAFRTILTTGYSLCPFKPQLDYLYNQAKFLQRTFSKRFEGPRQQPELNYDTFELLAAMGLGCEEYEAETKDGFLLRLHRLTSLRRETSCPSGRPPPIRPVVLMMHGLLMSDEVFVYDEQCSLAARLFRIGYDVWLGNNRGNKYSWRHREFHRTDERYWNFCIDDMAEYDIPALEEAVLRHTHSERIGYIGFSNGTAQMFAALATNRSLRVAVFIALAPACHIVDLHPSSVALRWLYPLMGSSRSLFSALFGRLAFLQVALQWQRVLSPELYCAAITICLKSLFSWSCANTCEEGRSKFFSHMYSTTSAKTVHQWFRMLRTGRFERYDTHGDNSVCEEPYRLSTIRTPVVLMYGGRDRLSDVNTLMQEIGVCTGHLFPNYEHLDFLCADDVATDLFPVVERALKDYMAGGNGAEKTGYIIRRADSLALSGISTAESAVESATETVRA